MLGTKICNADFDYENPSDDNFEAKYIILWSFACT